MSLSGYGRREIPGPGGSGKLYLDKLQQPNGNLPRAGRALLLGRGDAWVAVGMAEMLRSLPKNHPRAGPDFENLLEDQVSVEVAGC